MSDPTPSLSTYSSDNFDEIAVEGQSREFYQQLYQLQEVSVKLSRTESLDELFHVAVECAVHDLNIDRLGILMIDHDNDLMVGTWGTDEVGNVRSERDFAAPMQDEIRSTIEELSTRGKVCVWHDRELLEFAEQEGAVSVVGRGWNGAIAIWDKERVIGWIACDNLLRHRPFEIYQSHILRLFGSQLGELILRKRAEEQVIELNRGLERTVMERTLKLIEAQKELKEANKSLEDKVIKRTAILNTKNQQLEQTVNELKETQELLVRAQTQAALKDLVVGVAHEMNTPIGVATTAISSIPESLNQILQDVENDRITKSSLLSEIRFSLESSAVVKRNLERAASLVKEFKRISVVDTSNQESSFVDLDEMLHVCVQMAEVVEPQVKYQQVMIENRSGLGRIKVNQEAFCQVLQDLVVNAFIHGTQFAEEGQVQVLVDYVDDLLCVGVQDNGKGVDPSVAKKIFDPFVTTARSKGRKGLGLNVAFNLVTHTLQGALTHIPQEQGALFQMQIPIEQANA